MTSVPQTVTPRPGTTLSASESTSVPPGYKKTEVGVIPQDWEVQPVGCMGEVVTGKALAVNGPGQQRPYLRTKNVFDGRIDISDVLTMPMTDAMFAHFMLLRSDVLLNEGQSLDLVGRCAIYQDEYPRACAIQNQLLRFRAKAGVSALFASHLFRYSQETGVFARIALQTTSIAHLGSSRFARLQLPWPKSEVEQRAIAEALSDVDKLLESLEKLIAKKRAIKQAAMQQLLTGKTRLPGFSGKWELGKLADFGVFRSGNGFPLAFQGHQSGDYPFFKVSDLNNKGNELLLKNANHWISEDVKRTLGATKFSAGSIVFAKIGAAIFLERKRLLSRESCLDNNMMAFSLTIPEACEQFFHYLFLRIELGKLVSTTALPSLSGREIGAIGVPLPPPDEQRAIATVLSDMDAEITALERRRDKTRTIKQGMMQQLLTGRVRLVRPELDGKS